MKTFKQFKEDNQYVSEGAGAIIGGAFKLGSKALAAYSAYKAGDSLLKGKPKEAAVNAIGAVPGGRVFKGMKALGAGKRLSRLGSATQSLARYDELPGVSTSNPFSRGVNKVIEKGSEYVGKAYKKLKKK